MQKIKPILFNTAMVRATLDNRKTQTRRVVKIDHNWILEEARYYLKDHPDKFFAAGFKRTDVHRDSSNIKDFKSVKCPYQPGDILWVRETFAYVPGGGGAIYRATWRKDGWEKGPDAKWTPSIHMPKGACRTWLKVTGVRVERLQDISEKDAADEGVEREFDGEAWRFFAPDHSEHGDPRCAFMRLWDSLAKPGTQWSDNPWVWVYEFEICDKPEVVNA